MPLDNNRLLLEMDKAVREINREIINPEFSELTLENIYPVTKMVANARAAYLKELLDVSNLNQEGLPSADQIKRLNMLRRTYEELLSGAKALETAIQRGYLDVKS